MPWRPEPASGLQSATLSAPAQLQQVRGPLPKKAVLPTPGSASVFRQPSGGSAASAADAFASQEAQREQSHLARIEARQQQQLSKFQKLQK